MNFESEHLTISKYRFQVEYHQAKLNSDINNISNESKMTEIRCLMPKNMVLDRNMH